MISVTRGSVDLCQPPEPSPGQVERYGLFAPLQIGPRTAAGFCNRRTVGNGHWDYEDGSDVLIFDDLGNLGKNPPAPLTRDETERDEKTGGTRVIVKYPVGGGFVPLGALNARGAKHPHAGTGFGNCVTLSYLTDEAGYYNWRQECVHRIERRQFSYDGASFRVVGASVHDDADPLRVRGSGWAVENGAMSVSLPSGDDLLMPLLARREGETACGLCRWRREADEWRPVEFAPVAEGTEPSMVRERDGALLFAVRHAGDIRVWRSTDEGRTWTKIVDLPQACSSAPISINRAQDGSPFIAANLAGTVRAKLCFWPLNDARNGLLPPILIRDCAADFGPAPAETMWFADHPFSSTLRLGDGAHHSLLAYRVIAFSTKGRGGETLTPATGTYVEEVRSAGAPLPIWNWPS